MSNRCHVVTPKSVYFLQQLWSTHGHVCVCACLQNACLHVPHTQCATRDHGKEVSWSLVILGKEPLWEVNIHVAGRYPEDPPEASQLRWPTYRPYSVITLSLILMVSSLSRYEFWKINIPGLTHQAWPHMQQGQRVKLSCWFFCTPVSLSRKNNRTAFPDKPCIIKLVLGVTPHRSLAGVGAMCELVAS